MKHLMLLFLSLIYYSISLGQEKNRSIFIEWNKKTLESIEWKHTNAKDSLARRLYENRWEADLASWDIKNASHFNSNSIRFKFLSTIGHDVRLDEDEFYIVEITFSGERITIMSFVLVNRPGMAELFQYTYEDRKWLKQTQSPSLWIDSSHLFNDTVEFFKGSNDEDITATYFKNGIIRKSEFFLYGTLKKESKLKTLVQGSQ